jgi:hypothetical protein
VPNPLLPPADDAPSATDGDPAPPPPPPPEPTAEELQDRLAQLVGALRTDYSYCVFCGTQYGDDADMAAHCSGPRDEDHE